MYDRVENEYFEYLPRLVLAPRLNVLCIQLSFLVYCSKYENLIIRGTNTNITGTNTDTNTIFLPDMVKTTDEGVFEYYNNI